MLVTQCRTLMIHRGDLVVSARSFYGIASHSWWMRILRLFASLNAVEAEQEAAEQNDLAQANEEAERLLGLYGNSVLRLAYSYLHTMSDAEDVLQDTLIQLIKTKPRFESASHEKAWILRVAINISKNKITYNRIRMADELSESLAAHETEDLLFVWDAVKRLPQKYAEVIHLFYHEGYSTAQIAGLLGKKEATVRSLLQRARVQLKAVLKEVYDFGESV